MEESNRFVEQWVRPKDQEKDLIGKLIDRDELSGAGFGVCQAFEKCFAEYIGCRYCLTFSHGTAALMAAYYAAGVGPGDEVITPSVGYIASYAGAMHMGARPVFCDLDAKTFLVDIKQIREKITKRTKAINIIHMNGRICNLDQVLKISKEYGIPIIDDAAHACGAEWGAVKLGNFDHITCFSLQGANPRGKPVSGGEGGVACTNDLQSYQRMLAYCQLHRKNIMDELGEGPYSHLDMEVLGLKWRAHPLALAIAFLSLGSLDYRNAKLRESYSKTIEILKEFDFITVPTCPAKAKMAGFYGGFSFILNPKKLKGISCGELVHRLKAAGIDASGPRVGYSEYKRSIFTQGFDLWGRKRGPLGSAWAGLEKYPVCKPEDFPVSEYLQDKVIVLPGFIEVDPRYYQKLKETFQDIK